MAGIRNLCLALVIVFGTIFGPSEALNCEKIVTVRSKELFSYLANVTFPAPKPFSGSWQLEMKTNVPFAFLGGWDVMINEDGANGVATFHSKEEVTVKTGDLITLNFRISWEPRKPVPRVKEIVWEKQAICKSSPRSNEIRKIKRRKSVNFKFMS